MKRIIFISLFAISIALNGYLLISSYIKSTYTPTSEDLALLGEMTVMTLQSEEYAKIAAKETVHAIVPSVSRFNVSDTDLIYLNEIHVSTDKETYIFTCQDDACTKVNNGGWGYSRYSEEKPILPIKED